MPFRLLNGSSSFQGYINKILVKKLVISVIIYLDNILIYTKDESQTHVNTVWWILKKLKEHGLFAHLKKCRFYKHEFCFLRYVMSAQGVKIEDEQIELVKNWPEPKLMRDIQVFLGFANFYWRFI